MHQRFRIANDTSARFSVAKAFGTPGESDYVLGDAREQVPSLLALAVPEAIEQRHQNAFAAMRQDELTSARQVNFEPIGSARRCD